MTDDQPAAARRIVFVHAHPDDETIGTGATMARYAAEGARVTLVTCTRGEEGEVLVPEYRHLASDREDRLGPHREQELTQACAALGVADHRLLGGAGRYRDSGMAGSPANDRPDCFWRADLGEASAQLVRILREVRPQVLVTYDDFGGYGHPDHVQAHRVATAAVAWAAEHAWHPELGPAWQVRKVYWSAMPRSWVQRGLDALAASRDAEGLFDGVESADDLSFVVPDAVVAAEIDASRYVSNKMAAMRAHATQIAVDGPFYALSNNIGMRAWGTEFYRLAYGPRGVGDPAGSERDLFSGLDRAAEGTLT